MPDLVSKEFGQNELKSIEILAEFRCRTAVDESFLRKLIKSYVLAWEAIPGRDFWELFICAYGQLGDNLLAKICSVLWPRKHTHYMVISLSLFFCDCGEGTNE